MFHCFFVVFKSLLSFFWLFYGLMIKFKNLSTIIRCNSYYKNPQEIIYVTNNLRCIKISLDNNQTKLTILQHSSLENFHRDTNTRIYVQATKKQDRVSSYEEAVIIARPITLTTRFCVSVKTQSNKLNSYRQY